MGLHRRHLEKAWAKELYDRGLCDQEIADLCARIQSNETEKQLAIREAVQTSEKQSQKYSKEEIEKLYSRNDIVVQMLISIIERGIIVPSP